MFSTAKKQKLHHYKCHATLGFRVDRSVWNNSNIVSQLVSDWRWINSHQSLSSRPSYVNEFSAQHAVFHMKTWNISLQGLALWISLHTHCWCMKDKMRQLCPTFMGLHLNHSQWTGEKKKKDPLTKLWCKNIPQPSGVAKCKQLKAPEDYQITQSRYY